MARRRAKQTVVEEVGIDKVEIFIQSYYKQIIIGFGTIIIAFIAIYGGYTLYKNGVDNKIDELSKFEYLMFDNNSINAYSSMANVVPTIKSYVLLKSAEAWFMISDNASAVAEAKKVTGALSELAAGFEADLGETVDVDKYIQSGNMKPLWYYRAVVEAEPNEKALKLEQFRLVYPNNSLLRLLENWNL